MDPDANEPQEKLVRRAPARPLVRLGEREGASAVQPRAGTAFPAYPAKEKDFVLPLDVRKWK